MNNKMSLHIVWPFVILWILVAAMVGGDLIPLHVVERTAGIGKIVYLMDEFSAADELDAAEPVDDLVPVDQNEMTDQLDPTDHIDSVDPADPLNELNPIGEQLLEDSIISGPTNETALQDGVPEDSITEITYILNTNSMKFHEVDCHSAELISPENFKESFDTRDTIIANGYVPCKNCNP